MYCEAVVTATYLKNRWPTMNHRNMTPEEAWTGSKPSVSHLRVYGSLCSVHIPDQKRTTLDAKSWEGILVGYSETSKGYRVWDPKRRTVVVARDVIIREGVFPPAEGKGAEIREVKKTATLTIDELPEKVVELDDESVEEEEQPHAPPVRTSTRTRRPPERFGESLVIGSCHISEIGEPATLKEALSGPQKEKWLEAVKDELTSLEEHATWEVCELPAGRNPIGCKWVFKLKENFDGSIARFKARLVAKGYSQKEGVDYDETYSPVVSHESLRLLLAYGNQEEMDIHQMDVKTAFLNGILEQEVYMEIPEGYDVHNSEGKVLKLLKTIYGLKQAPREWNKVLHSFMRNQGMQQVKSDPAVYKRGKQETQLIVAVYVDDTTIMSKSFREIEDIKNALSRRFRMTDLGEVGVLLGMKVTRDREQGTLTLSQSKYMKTILEKFRMSDCAGKRTPMVVGVKLTKEMEPQNEEEVKEMSKVPYRQAVGSLMYLMTCTRPDIATAVSCVSSFMHNPGREHWNAVKRILQYVRHTVDYGLKFCRQADFTITGFSDSDWGGDVDTMRSTTGYVFLVGRAAVTWCSKKQSSVARSSTEAEHVASTQAGAEATWLGTFMKELGCNVEPIVIFTDNQANLKLMKKQEARGRTRHIAIQKAYVRELVERGIVTFEWVGTNEQVADFLTKGVPEAKMAFCREEIGITRVGIEN